MLETPTADGLWPYVKDAPSFWAMCRKLRDLGVLGLPASVKRPIARELCGRLGFEPSETSFIHNLCPSTHAEKRAEQAQAYAAIWRATPEGRERINAAGRKSCRARLATKEGAEKNRDKSRLYRGTARGQERLALWKADNPAYFREYARERKAEDPLYALAQVLRGHHQRVVRALDGSKDAETLTIELPCGSVEVFTRAEMVGCSLDHFRDHLEKLLAPGMTWANHGEWHYDHIVPVATIGENPTREQVLAVSHWTNWRPLWAAENLSKGSLHEGKRHRLRKAPQD